MKIFVFSLLSLLLASAVSAKNIDYDDCIDKDYINVTIYSPTYNGDFVIYESSIAAVSCELGSITKLAMRSTREEFKFFFPQDVEGRRQYGLMSAGLLHRNGFITSFLSSCANRYQALTQLCQIKNGSKAFFSEGPGVTEVIALDALLTGEDSGHETAYINSPKRRFGIKKLMQKIRLTISNDTIFSKNSAMLEDLV